MFPEHELLPAHTDGCTVRNMVIITHGFRVLSLHALTQGKYAVKAEDFYKCSIPDNPVRKMPMTD